MVDVMFGINLVLGLVGALVTLIMLIWALRGEFGDFYMKSENDEAIRIGFAGFLIASLFTALMFCSMAAFNIKPSAVYVPICPEASK